MYYLQSRYYDPVVGRFVNADSTEMLEAKYAILWTNLFGYCENNPINNKDAYGNFFQSTLMKIFAGVICGFVVQFLCDLIDYFIQIITIGKKKARFTSRFEDYLASILSYTLDFLNPFKSGKVIGKILQAYLPFATKYGYKFVSGAKIEAFSFWKDLFYATISFVVSLALGASQKSKIRKLKKTKMSTKQINVEKLKIKKSFKVLGEKISLHITISENIVSLIYNILTNLKAV